MKMRIIIEETRKVLKIYKKIATTFALFLIATFVISMFALPSSNAQSSNYRTKETYAMIGVLPNPVGV
jgi:CHASE3 domain sensor protein